MRSVERIRLPHHTEISTATLSVSNSSTKPNHNPNLVKLNQLFSFLKPTNQPNNQTNEQTNKPSKQTNKQKTSRGQNITHPNL